MVPVLLLNVTVVALTVFWKAAPPLLVMVKVPISVPTAPLTFTAAVLLKVTFDELPLLTPLIAPVLIGVAAPLPNVKVTPSLIVTAPNVIVPVPAVIVVSAVTVVLLLPRFTLWLVAEIVPATDLLEGAVAVTPPVKLELSPESFPNVRAPVLLNVVAEVMLTPALKVML